MTWHDLAKRISEMSINDRKKTVQFRQIKLICGCSESLDDVPAIFEVNFHRAHQDLTDPHSEVFDKSEEVVRIKKGEFFLQ